MMVHLVLAKIQQARTLFCGSQVRHNGSAWLVPRSRACASRFIDVLEEYMKSLVVEYPEELPGLLKMTEEQLLLKCGFLPQPSSLSWAS
jgi:hypothetical protein